MDPIRVLLADDHSVVRAGLKALIETQPDMVVVGEASDGREVLDQLTQATPDIVVLDLSMPRLNGLETAQRLRVGGDGPRVLILSVHEDASYLRRALEAGATGYVLKRAAAESLIGAIREGGAGRVYLDPALGATLAESVVGVSGRASGDSAALSEREGTVLRLIAEGYSNKEIATQLDLSVKTVETYKARAMEKLGIHSRVGIVRYASEQGWLRQL
ncbi:MAG TPA: response regulator transcription factor [Chloroflexaceae bacterium]|nr:response regulator transcription factor [Chloroflexaceae bacterium]